MMFVNYSHPADLKDPAKKRVVSCVAARPRRMNPNLVTKHAPGTFKWRKDSSNHSSPSESSSASPEPSNAISPNVHEECQETEENCKGLSGASLNDLPGSFRDDPFNTFPIEASGMVPLAIDYYTNYFGPTTDLGIAARCQLGGRPMMTRNFPFVLQSDVAFEALVLFMIIHSGDSAFGSPEQRRRAIAVHRNNVLSKLNQRLADPRTCSDNISLHTILSLIAADYHGRDYQSLQIHLKGLRQLVGLRGGLAGLSPFMQIAVLGVESMCLFASEPLDTPANNVKNSKKLELAYPIQPFNPKISQMISQIPVGFNEMVLGGGVSTQMLTLLHRYHFIVQGRKESSFEDPTDDLTGELEQMATELEMNTLEGVICSSLLVYRATISNAETPQWIRARVRALARSVYTLRTKNSAEREFILWVAMVAATAEDSDELSYPQRLDLVCEINARYPVSRNWPILTNLLKRFYWDERSLKRLENLMSWWAELRREWNLRESTSDLQDGP